MNIRILLLRIIPIILLGILCTCIIYYSIQYSNLNIDQKLNFNKNWYWFVLDTITIIAVSLNVITIRKNSKAFGNIEYREKRLQSRLLILELMFVGLCVPFLLIDFFTYPSVSKLSMIIIF